MVRVLGNSSERVPLRDLNDVVYYRQVKEYSDHDYETSRDLNKALAAGKLTFLERVEPVKGSIDVGKSNGVSVGDEVRAALREMMPVQSQPDMGAMAREVAPVVAEMVRQEISKLSLTQIVTSGGTPSTVLPGFMGPEYVPTVTTEGMISNVEAKTTEASGEGTDDALAVLRRMQKS